jgi:hypothetical protein
MLYKACLLAIALDHVYGHFAMMEEPLQKYKVNPSKVRSQHNTLDTRDTYTCDDIKHEYSEVCCAAPGEKLLESVSPKCFDNIRDLKLKTVYDQPDVSKPYTYILGERIQDYTINIQNQNGVLQEFKDRGLNVDPSGTFVRYDSNGVLTKKLANELTDEERVLASLKDFTFRIHGKDHDYVNFDSVSEAAYDAFTYFVKRGYALPGKDKLTTLDQEKIFGNSLGSVRPQSLVFDLNHFKQNYINVYLSGSTRIRLQLYNNTDDPRQSNFVSVPVITNENEFETMKQNNESVVLFNEWCNTLDFSLHNMTFKYDYGLSGFEDMHKYESVHFKAVSVRRSTTNDLIPTYPYDAVALMPMTNIDVVDGDANQLDTYSIPLQNSDGSYRSLPMIPFMGGSGALDIQITAENGLNGYSSTQHQTYTASGVQPGDNPFTSQTETFGYNTFFEVFNSARWGVFVKKVSDLNNFDIPEAPFNPQKSYLNDTSVLEGVRALIMHELWHSVQFGRGMVNSATWVNSEGSAVSFEFDENLLGEGTFSTFARIPSMLAYIMNLRRGWNIPGFQTIPLYDNDNKFILDAPDYVSMSKDGGVLRMANYGESLLYYYMKKFDKNLQLHKVFHHEVVKLHGTKSRTEWEELFLSSSDDDRRWNPNFYATTMVKSLSIIREEASGIETYEDFIIAATLMRNNPELPEKYRINIPFWYLRSDVDEDYRFKLLGGEAFSFVTSDYMTIWDRIKTNEPNPALHHFYTIRFNERFTPAWPRITVVPAPIAPANPCSSALKHLQVKFDGDGNYFNEVTYRIFVDGELLVEEADLLDQVTNGPRKTVHDLCLQPAATDLKLEMVDAYGDGWNGNSLIVWFDGNPLTCENLLTLPSGSFEAKEYKLAEDFIEVERCRIETPESNTFSVNDTLATSVTRKMFDLSSFTLRMEKEKSKVTIAVNGTAEVACRALTFKTSIPRALHQAGPVVATMNSPQTLDFVDLFEYDEPVDFVCFNRHVTDPSTVEPYIIPELSVITLT